MATLGDTKPTGGEAGHYEADHVEDASSTEKNVLQRENTLQYIDVENHQAFKGDDSDGKVEWNWRSITASFFLCTLYTGTFIVPQPTCTAY